MIRDRVRITLRLHRFELVAFALAFIVFAGGTFLAAAWIASLTPPLSCFGIDDGSESASVLACRVAKRAFDEASAMTFGLTAPLLAISYVVGLFLGVPLVARELERGTSRLAWSLAPSRWRWYVTTVVPVAADPGAVRLCRRCRARSVLRREPPHDRCRRLVHRVRRPGRARHAPPERSSCSASPSRSARSSVAPGPP